MDLALQHPVFGPEINCPYCRQKISALTLTDTYLCNRHGAFEAESKIEELVHLSSGRCWRRWENRWYRQYTHPDGIRFEIHEALDVLYTEGYRATKVIIASRYRDLVSSHLGRSHPWRNDPEFKSSKLYGLPIKFSSEDDPDPCWEIINFVLEKEPGVPRHYPYRFLLE